MHDLEALKQQNPLSELVEMEYGQPKTKGRWRLWCCPFPDHQDDTPSFAVDQNERFVCFGCGKEGDLFDYLQQMNGWDLMESIERLGGAEISEEERLQQKIQLAERQRERLDHEIEASKRALSELQSARMWLTYEKYLSETPTAQEMWAKAGLPDVWQEIFHVGYSPDFYAGSSLTIPIYTPFYDDPVNIRHRIIGATGDKYRPELAGLPLSFYWAHPKLGVTDTVFLVEGEKKAMVLMRYLALVGMNDTQVLGIMGKNGLKSELVSQLEDVKDVLFVPDPDVTKDKIWQTIKTLNKPTTLLDYPYKIDDMLIDGMLDGHDVWNMRYSGVRVNGN